MLKRLWYMLFFLTMIIGLFYLMLGQEYITYINEDVRNRLDDIVDLLENEDILKGGN